jgi:hypothetical protein
MKVGDGIMKVICVSMTNPDTYSNDKYLSCKKMYSNDCIERIMNFQNKEASSYSFWLYNYRDEASMMHIECSTRCYFSN